jgi:hypothetical protein
VTLGLDASALEKGAEKANAAQKKIGATAAQTAKDIEKQEKALAEAQVKRGKELEARAKVMAQGISKLRNEALALFAAFTGAQGIKNFITNTISAEAGLQRMSANLGISASELGTWQLANERAGGSIEGMTDQLKEAAAAVAQYKSGQGMTSGVQMGFQYGLTDADMKDGNTLMLARARILAQIKDPTVAMYRAAQMGISEDTFNLMKQGPIAVEQLRLKEKQLADERARNAPAAEEFRKKWIDLTHEFQNMAIKILPELMPLLERLANWLISVIPDIESFAKKINSGVESLGGWTNVLVALGALKILSMTSGLIGLANALVGVGSALGVIGGAVGVAALATMTGLGLLTASSGLNKGEDAELARRRKMAPTIDGTAGGAAAMFANLEAKYGLPPGTLDSMWLQESGRGKNMLSKAGAKGHFQFMDPTAKQYGLKNPNDLAESSDAAARMMSDLLKKYNGNMSMALMAYNGGQGNLDRKGAAGMSQESKDYAPSIMKRIGAGASARAAGGGNTSSTDVKVGVVNVSTQATDAKGIAQSIGGAISQYGFMSQANTGLS